MNEQYNRSDWPWERLLCPQIHSFSCMISLYKSLSQHFPIKLSTMYKWQCPSNPFLSKDGTEGSKEWLETGTIPKGMEDHLLYFIPSKGRLSIPGGPKGRQRHLWSGPHTEATTRSHQISWWWAVVQGVPGQVGLLWCNYHWVLPSGSTRVGSGDMSMTHFDCPHIQCLPNQDLKADPTTPLVFLGMGRHSRVLGQLLCSLSMARQIGSNGVGEICLTSCHPHEDTEESRRVNELVEDMKYDH